jgi:hypothetical protein
VNFIFSCPRKRGDCFKYLITVIFIDSYFLVKLPCRTSTAAIYTSFFFVFSACSILQRLFLLQAPNLESACQSLSPPLLSTMGSQIQNINFWRRVATIALLLITLVVAIPHLLPRPLHSAESEEYNIPRQLLTISVTVWHRKFTNTRKRFLKFKNISTHYSTPPDTVATIRTWNLAS